MDPATLCRRDDTAGNPSSGFAKDGSDSSGMGPCHPEGVTMGDFSAWNHTGRRAGGHLRAATSTSAAFPLPCVPRSCKPDIPSELPRAARVVGRI